MFNNFLMTINRFADVATGNNHAKVLFADQILDWSFFSYMYVDSIYNAYQYANVQFLLSSRHRVL